MTHTHTHKHTQFSGPSKFCREHQVAAAEAGSRHGSVIPVLAENPNNPEEQSSVVMCGQSLQTNLSSQEPTCAPVANLGLSLDQTGRGRHREAAGSGENHPENSHCDMSTRTVLRGASARLSAQNTHYRYF